jgi:hypothetical protein
MKKHFKLPKAFADIWLEALRSGKYKQTTSGSLVVNNKFDNSISYCCLGVAGALCNVDEKRLSNHAFLGDFDSISPIPVELQGPYDLPGLLSILNDGVKSNDLKTRRKKFLFWTELDEQDYIQMDFNQIADFIEHNVILY